MCVNGSPLFYVFFSAECLKNLSFLFSLDEKLDERI